MSQLDPIDDKTSHVIVRKRLSLQETLSERMPMIVFLTITGCFMLIASAFLPLFLLATQWSLLGMLYWVGATCAFVMAAACAIRVCGQLCSSGLKEIEKLEGDLSTASTNEPVADLQRLVDLHHKHRHFDEAEFYSQRLLHALANAAQGKLIPTLASADCWLTTPAYKRSVTGKFLWLFETRGRVLLTEETLWFWSPKVNLRVALEDISSVQRCKYSWWQKPVPTYYIVVGFVAEAAAHEIELTAGPQTGNIYDINRATTALYEKLQQALGQKHRLPKGR